MNAAAWIALAGVLIVVLVHIVATIWWAATVSAEVKELKARSIEHGSMRDIVIELRTDMRQFSKAISDLAEELKGVRRTSARQGSSSERAGR